MPKSLGIFFLILGNKRGASRSGATSECCQFCILWNFCIFFVFLSVSMRKSLGIKVFFFEILFEIFWGNFFWIVVNFVFYSYRYKIVDESPKFLLEKQSVY
jgi:hypothetical protein